MLLFAIAGLDESRATADPRSSIIYEENRILHAQLGTRRLRFDDEQRRRLAERAKLLGRRVLAGVATIVTPDTLLRSHRKLIAGKYDGSAIEARTANKGGRSNSATVDDILIRKQLSSSVKRKR